MDPTIAIDDLPEVARKVLNGAAPLKLMAARGLTPMPPAALVSTVCALANDADEKVAQAARQTLGRLPDKVLEGALADRDLPAPVLAALAPRYADRRPVLERVVQHGRTPVETLVQIGTTADEALCELLATNEQRLLQHPSIIEALYLNRALRMSTADRLVELAARNGVTLALPGFEEAAASLRDQLLPEPGEPTPMDDVFREAIAEAESVEAGEDDVVDRDEEGVETVKEKFERVHKKLADMTLSEKIRLALIGSASQRQLLMRSPHRALAVAAVSSPRAGEAEAASIAASTQVIEDVLRFVANKREWVRLYTVKRNLCGNPKTPVAISMRLLPHLREADLRSLARSRNIPAALRTGVNQLLQKRTPG